MISTKLNHSFLEGLLVEAKETFKAQGDRYRSHEVYPSGDQGNKQLMGRGSCNCN